MEICCKARGRELFLATDYGVQYSGKRFGFALDCGGGWPGLYVTKEGSRGWTWHLPFPLARPTLTRSRVTIAEEGARA